MCYVPSGRTGDEAPFPVPQSGKRITLVTWIGAYGSFLNPLIVIPRKTTDPEITFAGLTDGKVAIYSQSKTLLMTHLLDLIRKGFYRQDPLTMQTLSISRDHRPVHGQLYCSFVPELRISIHSARDYHLPSPTSQFESDPASGSIEFRNYETTPRIWKAHSDSQDSITPYRPGCKHIHVDGASS
jgi:hypothetical protein